MDLRGPTRSACSLLMTRGRHADWFAGAVAAADGTGCCSTNPAWLRWEGSEAESVGSSEEGGGDAGDEDVLEGVEEDVSDEGKENIGDEEGEEKAVIVDADEVAHGVLEEGEGEATSL